MKVEEAPLISVILPTYNRARTLVRAISSVLNQTYTNLELIVVDDASKDNTDEIMAAYANDPRVRYVKRERNQGQCAARNAGLEFARGDFIAYQDSDDEWLANKLERQMEAALASGEKDVVVFHMALLYGRDEARVYGTARCCCVPNIAEPVDRRDFVKMTHLQNLMRPQTLLLSRSLLEKSGPWDELLVNSVDWDFSLRLTRAGHVIYIEEPLVVAYIQPDSISTFKRNMVRSQVRILLKLNRQPDVERHILGHHFARIGTSLSRLGKRRMADRFLRRAVWLAPTKPKNWARIVLNGAMMLKPNAPSKA